MGELSAASFAILRQLVLGQKMDEVPEDLVQMRLVRSETLRSQVGYLRNVWVATKNGRMMVARSEASASDET